MTLIANDKIGRLIGPTHRVALVLGVLSIVGGCTADGPVTGDPPDYEFPDAGGASAVVVRQVFVNEVSEGLALAYGDHPDVSDDDDREVTRAGTWEPEVLVIFSDRVQGLSMGEGEEARVPGDAVTLLCDGEPVDLSMSWQASYTPYGGQSFDPEEGPASLGPQLRLFPGAMKMGSTCGIELGEGVVGADGTRVCAPADGDAATPCTPGDLTGIEFGVLPFEFLGALPADGAVDVWIDNKPMLQFNGEVAPDSLGGITLEDEVGTIPITPTVGSADEVMVHLAPEAPLSADTTYTIRIPAGDAGPRELMGGTLRDEVVISFRTAP